jgi:hypothetical protein
MVSTLILSWDFIKELLSWGPEMAVIGSVSLRQRVRMILKENLEQYNKNSLIGGEKP